MSSPTRTSLTDGLVPARCDNGHPITIWAGPLLVKRGEGATWMNAPLFCHCGSRARGR